MGQLGGEGGKAGEALESRKSVPFAPDVPTVLPHGSPKLIPSVDGENRPILAAEGPFGIRSLVAEVRFPHQGHESGKGGDAIATEAGSTARRLAENAKGVQVCLGGHGVNGLGRH